MPPILKGGKNEFKQKNQNFDYIDRSRLWSVTCDHKLGTIFPGNPAPGGAPWFIWAAIGETMAFIIAAVVIGIVVRKKDKENYE